MSVVKNDITGQRFGKLVALRHVPGGKGVRGKWQCLCDCGNEATVHPYCLRHGMTRSCGCLKSETPAPNKIQSLVM